MSTNDDTTVVPAPASTGQLAAALARVQAELPVVNKGESVTVRTDKGTYSYRYADLADVSAAIMPLLAKHELAFTCQPYPTSHGFQLRGVLMHSSGEQIEGTLPLTGQTPQALGGSITYMRRYLLGCMTGVVTDDDDDARSASEPARSARPARPAQQAPRQRPAATTRQRATPDAEPEPPQADPADESYAAPPPPEDVDEATWVTQWHEAFDAACQTFNMTEMAVLARSAGERGRTDLVDHAKARWRDVAQAYKAEHGGAE